MDCKSTYLYHIGYMFGVQQGLIPIILSLLDIAQETSNGLTIYLNKSLKQDIACKLNISLARIDNSVSDLVKAGYLIRVARGKYIFDDVLFGKNSWHKIVNILAAYDYGTGEIKVSFITEGTNNL